MNIADEPSIVATLRARIAVLTELLHAALDVAWNANVECDHLRERHERVLAELRAPQLERSVRKGRTVMRRRHDV